MGVGKIVQKKWGRTGIYYDLVGKGNKVLTEMERTVDNQKVENDDNLLYSTCQVTADGSLHWK